jgi:hypothetical protein
MPAPTLQSSSPANGATAVPKNASISFVFDVALDPDSVNGQTVVVYNAHLNERVECEVGLSSDGLTVSVTPAGHLFPDTGYRVRIIGADTSTTCLKSATDDDLALTLTTVFQTGDTLETGSTPSEGDGDLQLPDDVTIGAAGTMGVLTTTPDQNDFGISPGIESLAFRFSAPIDPGSVTGNVTLVQTAFYDEERFLARLADLGQGDGWRHYFAGETGAYTVVPPGILDPELFRDREYELRVEGDTLYLDFEDDYEFPKNMALEVTLGEEITDTDGNPLGSDYTWVGYVEAYPVWASLLAVRHHAGYDVAGIFPDSFVGLRTWMATIDTLGEFNWTLPSDNPHRYQQEYVRVRAAIELWQASMEQKGLDAGTSKRLGDFEISVNTAAGSARPAKLRLLEDRLAELDQILWGGLTQTPRVGIRSILDAYEPGRGYFRDRLWRLELPRRQDRYMRVPAANTAAERNQGGIYPTALYGGSGLTPGGAGSRHSL